jgi:uncharacterized lipoprotein
VILKSTIQTFVLAAVLPLVVAGCSMFRSNSGWEQAAESRPLEIPPDLQTPPNTGDLIVPESSGNAARSASTATGIDGLHVNDSVESTWQRVGLALERGAVGEIANRDEAAHTYALNVTTKRVTGDEGGFFKRLITRKKTTIIKGQVNVGVSSDGTGSRVSVSGDAASVKRISALLRERLG